MASYNLYLNKFFKISAGVFVINGFEEAGTIPVNFPIDICLFKAGPNYHAAVLHYESFKSSNTILKIFRSLDGEYYPIFEYRTHYAHTMDCVTATVSGFVAVLNRFSVTEHAIEVSSPVFRVTQDEQVEQVLQFAAPYQNSVHLWAYGDEIFLSHTFLYPEGDVVNRKPCPIFKWTGHQFIFIADVQCFDSHHLEFFAIDYEIFLAVANFRDDKGASNIFSYIYKFDVAQRNFVLLQQIFTYAAHDIRYFELELKSEQFLVVENAYRTFDDGSRNYQIESVVYKYVNGAFVPFQSLVFDNVTQILPVVGHQQEFILLVACEGRDVETLQYDGWKFVPAQIDYARDAFGRGVKSMRCYNQFSDKSLIVIANENHNAGDTAFYFPIFKLKNDIKKFYQKFMSYAEAVIEKYSQQNLPELLESLKVSEDLFLIPFFLSLFLSLY